MVLCDDHLIYKASLVHHTINATYSHFNKSFDTTKRCHTVPSYLRDISADSSEPSCRDPLLTMSAAEVLSEDEVAVLPVAVVCPLVSALRESPQQKFQKGKQ